MRASASGLAWLLVNDVASNQSIYHPVIIHPSIRAFYSCMHPSRLLRVFETKKKGFIHEEKNYETIWGKIKH